MTLTKNEMRALSALAPEETKKLADAMRFTTSSRDGAHLRTGVQLALDLGSNTSDEDLLAAVARAREGELHAGRLREAILSEPGCISNRDEFPEPCGHCMACRLRRTVMDRSETKVR